MYVYIILVIGTVLGALGGFFFKKCTSSGDIKGIIFSPFLYVLMQHNEDYVVIKWRGYSKMKKSLKTMMLL